MKKRLDKPGPEIYNQYMTNVRGALIKSVSPMDLKWGFTNCPHTPPKDSISLEFHFKIVIKYVLFLLTLKMGFLRAISP